MGSDRTWELDAPALDAAALSDLFTAAAGYDLRPQRPDGLITVFPDNGDPRTVTTLAEAISAMALDGAAGQFWTNGDTDIFLSLADRRLTWTLDAVFTHGEAFPDLYARLTALWLDTVHRLDAGIGRVQDEWSSDQVWHRPGLHDDPGHGWPAFLGWETYLGPGRCRDLPPPPLPEITAATRRLPNGGLLISLFEDPPTVDPLKYEELHTRWRQASERMAP